MFRTIFDTNLSLIIIEATIEKESKKTLRVALDTGCSRTIIPFEVAMAIGCDPAVSVKRTRIVTGSGIEIAPVVRLKNIKALGKVVKNLEVACHDLPPEGFVDGLLGIDFLRKFDLFIKFGEGIIEVNPVRKFGKGFKPLPNNLFFSLNPALTDGAFSNGVNSVS